MLNDATNNNDSNTMNVIKQYIAPGLFSIIGLFLWRDVSEMRADLKTLIVKGPVDDIKIQNMQTDLDLLKAKALEGSVFIYPKQPAKKEEEQRISRR